MSWQENALVEATPISGPASVGITTEDSRRDGRGRHVHDAHRVLALALGVAQGGQGVGGLARLRDDQRQPVALQGRLAVAGLRRDIDLHRQAGDLLEPVASDEAGIEAVPQAVMYTRLSLAKLKGSASGRITRPSAIST